MQVVVCVVADGRLKINARTRSVLAALGVYQDGVGKNVINGKPVVRTLLNLPKLHLLWTLETSCFDPCRLWLQPRASLLLPMIGPGSSGVEL